MPVEYAGFTLKPMGFFDRNPAIDLAPVTPPANTWEGAIRASGT